MKKTAIALMLALLFIGCNSSDEVIKNVEPKLVVGNSLSGLTLNDQFETQHILSPSTNKVVFAFAKEPAHVCNDFLNTKAPTYLKEHDAEFIADVSAAPSLIRSLFILPGLKDFKHTVLLLDDKNTAAPFRKNMDVEKIVVVFLKNNEITEVKTISTSEELEKILTSP